MSRIFVLPRANTLDQSHYADFAVNLFDGSASTWTSHGTCFSCWTIFAICIHCAIYAHQHTFPLMTMERLLSLLITSSLVVTPLCIALGTTSTTTTTNNLKAAVLVPGFLTGANDFKQMVARLNDRGIPTVAVPMPNWHWLPCLGGRSVRPMLERIDFTVKHLLACEGDVTNIPNFQYSLMDAWHDIQDNPGGISSVGGSSDVDSYPVVQPRGTFQLPDSIPNNTKIALIGHSAGGWISRAYLSDRNYGGKVYDGKRYIHSLVTLGSPHLEAPGPAFEGIKWVDKEPALVRSLAVGGTGFAGDAWGQFTQGSYAFCANDGSDGSTFTGDGVTPIQSSLAYEGAETLELPGVHHFCWSEVFGGNYISPELTQDYSNGSPWYGSDSVIDKWVTFLEDA
jgi:pimeloyl-ACP methyl ester carboxylesterase